MTVEAAETDFVFLGVFQNALGIETSFRRRSPSDRSLNVFDYL